MADPNAAALAALKEFFLSAHPPGLQRDVHGASYLSRARSVDIVVRQCLQFFSVALLAYSAAHTDTPLVTSSSFSVAVVGVGSVGTRLLSALLSFARSHPNLLPANAVHAVLKPRTDASVIPFPLPGSNISLERAAACDVVFVCVPPPAAPNVLSAIGNPTYRCGPRRPLVVSTVAALTQHDVKTLIDCDAVACARTRVARSLLRSPQSSEPVRVATYAGGTVPAAAASSSILPRAGVPMGPSSTSLHPPTSSRRGPLQSFFESKIGGGTAISYASRTRCSSLDTVSMAEGGGRGEACRGGADLYLTVAVHGSPRALLSAAASLLKDVASHAARQPGATRSSNEVCALLWECMLGVGDVVGVLEEVSRIAPPSSCVITSNSDTRKRSSVPVVGGVSERVARRTFGSALGAARRNADVLAAAVGVGGVEVGGSAVEVRLGGKVVGGRGASVRSREVGREGGDEFLQKGHPDGQRGDVGDPSRMALETKLRLRDIVLPTKAVVPAVDDVWYSVDLSDCNFDGDGFDIATLLEGSSAAALRLEGKIAVGAEWFASGTDSTRPLPFTAKQLRRGVGRGGGADAVPSTVLGAKAEDRSAMSLGGGVVESMMSMRKFEGSHLSAEGGAASFDIGGGGKAPGTRVGGGTKAVTAVGGETFGVTVQVLEQMGAIWTGWVMGEGRPRGEDRFEGGA